MGFGFLLVSIFAEIRDKLLITKALTYAGLVLILSSLVFILISKFVVDYSGVNALRLIASSMMLLIYLGTFLVSFFRASKAILVE